MLLGLVLNAAALCVIVYLVTRGTAEIDFVTMVIIALAISVAGFFLGRLAGDPYVATALTIPLMLLLTFLLMKYCYTTLKQAIISSVLFFVWQFALSMAFVMMLR